MDVSPKKIYEILSQSEEKWIKIRAYFSVSLYYSLLQETLISRFINIGITRTGIKIVSHFFVIIK